MDHFLNFLKNIRDMGLEYYKRYYSTYPALVVDVDDPEKRGRVKLKCPTLFGPTYILPVWAEASDYRISGKGHGEFFPPYKGSYVEVFFEYGDLQLPMYKGGFFAQDELPSDFSESYGNIRGFVFKSGQKLIFDERQGKEVIKLINTDGSKLVFDGSEKTASMVHSSGAAVSFDSSGNVSIKDKSGNESIVLSEGEMTMKSGGSATFSGKQTTVGGSGATTVKGTSITLGSGGSPVALAFKSKAIGTGNLGIPVVSTIISGSSVVVSE